MTKTMTEKQIAANRSNAKMGGVKTAKGKAVSRYNALKHGLLSKELLLKDENEEVLEELGKRVRGELKPANEIEQMLVDRIIANFWRLKRAMRIEKEMIEFDANDTDYIGNMKYQSLGDIFSSAFIGRDKYGTLIRYETCIERGIFKALHELQRLQSVREGQNVPVPVAIDVDVRKD